MLTTVSIHKGPYYFFYSSFFCVISMHEIKNPLSHWLEIQHQKDDLIKTSFTKMLRWSQVSKD